MEEMLALVKILKEYDVVECEQTEVDKKILNFISFLQFLERAQIGRICSFESRFCHNQIGETNLNFLLRIILFMVRLALYTFSATW